MVDRNLLRLNALTGKAMRWPPAAPATLAKATMEQRCPPRLAVLQGRLQAVWMFEGSIMQADVESVLKGKGKPVRICSGFMPAVTVSGNTMHMVYVADGALRYRAIQGD
jgi:hypothetical protein